MIAKKKHVRMTYEIQIQVKKMTLGLMIIALIMFVMQVIRAIRFTGSLEYLYMAVTAGAWVLIAASAYMIRKEHGAYARIMICAILMVVLTFVEFLVAYHNVVVGLEEQTFISFGVMLLNFLTVLGTFYVYYHLLGTGTAHALMRGYPSLAAVCRKKGAGSFVVIVLCMILVPVMKIIESSYLAEKAGSAEPVVSISLIGTLVLGIIAVILQAVMCLRIQQAYGLTEYVEKPKSDKEQSKNDE